MGLECWGCFTWTSARKDGRPREQAFIMQMVAQSFCSGRQEVKFFRLRIIIVGNSLTNRLVFREIANKSHSHAIIFLKEKNAGTSQRASTSLSSWGRESLLQKQDKVESVHKGRWQSTVGLLTAGSCPRLVFLCRSQKSEQTDSKQMDLRQHHRQRGM